jgi:N-acetylglutamate synthase-like GNAT family acetyltransferase
MQQHLVRQAESRDISALRSLIKESAQTLCADVYTTEQINACIGTVFGVDQNLISDRTYFIAECEGTIVACGGWGKRGTPFGVSSEIPPLLNPEVDAARIRCFFVKPGFQGRGIAKSIMQHCEEDVKQDGFKRMELTATLTGVRLYEKCGFIAQHEVTHKLKDDLDIKFVKMTKTIY